MKLSGVPEEAYNSWPSEFGGYWLCACIHRSVYRRSNTLQESNVNALLNICICVNVHILYSCNAHLK